MSIRIFIHGLESGNRGTKARYFGEHFPDMLTPDFTGDLQKRMAKLSGVLSGKSEIKIVGSSFGGLMASIYAMENKSAVERLVLLAPAINLMGFYGVQEDAVDIPVLVYHGINDDVIPLEDALEIAQKCFTNLTFNKVEDDHMLHNTFAKIDWQEILK